MNKQNCYSLISPEEQKLTIKQQEAFDYMVAGKNIFLTGPSGTGKSLVIRQFREAFGSKKKIAITSTTGISALLIGGSTLHSYLGIGLGHGGVYELADSIMKKPPLRNRWQELDILIIDEISMLSPELFDKLEQIARIVRKKRLLSTATYPFGGIQLVLSGDFLQLPVVKGNNEPEDGDFCFEAKTWSSCIDHTVYLTEIIRQADVEFQEVLNDLRVGQVTEKAENLLNSRINCPLANTFGIKPTRIYTTNADVDRLNEKELKLLDIKTEFFEYELEIEFCKFIKYKQQTTERFRRNCIAPSILQLCKNAQVMLLCNLDVPGGLANGSRGVVVEFIENMPVVRFLNGQERVIDYNTWECWEGSSKVADIIQIPLKLAWAVTVHKSQGATLDYAEIDLNNTFTYGQAYVALSRVKNKEGLSILGIDYNDIRAHPKALAFYKSLSRDHEA